MRKNAHKGAGAHESAAQLSFLLASLNARPVSVRVIRTNAKTGVRGAPFAEFGVLTDTFIVRADKFADAGYRGSAALGRCAGDVREATSRL